MNATEHVLEVWGELACWARPELKVERWSYPCPTPSAARGVFDAIFCKPHNHRNNEKGSAEFRWQVTRVELLTMPTYIALRRNEVGAVASTRNVQQWMNGATPEALFADDDSVRQQRQTMALRDVRFRVTGRIVPWPGHREQQKALDEQFVRRARQGKCFQQPYLGCREFVAFFEYVEPSAQRDPPVDYPMDLGFMLYDVFDLSSPQRNDARPFISVFPAKIEHGVLNVPDWDDPAVRKPNRRAEQ
jgi:CRISPR-associated protein Cas5d